MKSHGSTIAYWVVTLPLALECAVGGVMGGLQLPVCQNHGTPGLPELLYDNHWYLVCACWDSFAYPAFSSPQGVGLCRPDLSLHGSDCIPSSSGRSSGYSGRFSDPHRPYSCLVGTSPAHASRSCAELTLVSCSEQLRRKS